MNNYLIYTLVTCWEEPPRSRHQVSYELSRSGKVFFVERSRTGLPKLAIHNVSDTITVITPYFWLPYKVRYRLAFINNLYHKWLLKKIKQLNIDFSAVVNFDYTATTIHEYFDKCIFYCGDDNVGFGKFNPAIINEYHQQAEKAVAANAKVCIATSDYMLEKIKRYNPNTYLVTLGAPTVNTLPVFEQKERRMFPVLCIVGYLDSNLDYSLLSALLADHRIIFIGPVNKKNAEKLKNSNNAVFAGVKTGRDLYDTIMQADVCIAPYEVSELNKGATPNKLWLYLALGKPAVITAMPNISNWKFEKGTVYICTNDRFISACKDAYLEDNEYLMNKRMEIASANSWKAKVDKILQYLNTK